MNKRNVILEVVAERLRANPLFGTIYLGQRRALDTDMLPCTTVTISDETSEVAARADDLEIKKSATLTVQHVITDLGSDSSKDTLEMELHELSAEGEALIMADDSLGDTVSRIAPVSMAVETVFDGETPVGLASNKYLVEYYQRVEVDKKAAQLKRFFISVGGSA